MDKILSIVGPTGIGKTELSLQLARELNGEIISGDSMQVYCDMNIGTAKIRKDQMGGIPHHLVDIQAIDQPYNVKVFQEKARECIQDIQGRKKIPIFCGGTGLYLKAAMYDYSFEEENTDTAFRKYLESLSSDVLYGMLQEQDPQACKTIHANNRQRVIRALEIAKSGKNKTTREQEQEHHPIYDVFWIGLDMDRSLLYERIEKRVDKMFEEGLVQEVESLFKDPETWQYTSFQGIGYKEFRPYFEGQCTLEEVKEKIKVHTRQYAKRQYTWFKHQMPVHWFEKGDPNLVEEVKEWLYGK